MYINGHIYRIVCLIDPKIQYVGSTFNELRHRWQSHKADYKNYLKNFHSKVAIYPYFTQYGIENFKIIKIKDYIVYAENKKDHKHLFAYEQLWINKLKCINEMTVFNPLKKLLKLTNSKIKQKENYAIRTEEQIKKDQERQKKRNETIRSDPELLDKKRKQQRKSAAKPWTCNICNITINQSGRCRHLKTKSHLENLAKNTTTI